MSKPTADALARFADLTRPSLLRPHAVKQASPRRGWRSAGDPSTDDANARGATGWPTYWATPDYQGTAHDARADLRALFEAFAVDGGEVADADRARVADRAATRAARAVRLADLTAEADAVDRARFAPAEVAPPASVADLYRDAFGDEGAARLAADRAEIAPGWGIGSDEPTAPTAPTIADAREAFAEANARTAAARESTTDDASPLAALRTPRPSAGAAYDDAARFAALDLDALDGADLGDLAPSAPLDADAVRMAERFGRLEVDAVEGDTLGDAFDAFDEPPVEVVAPVVTHAARWVKVDGNVWGARISHTFEATPRAGDLAAIRRRNGVTTTRRLQTLTARTGEGSRWTVSDLAPTS